MATKSRSRIAVPPHAAQIKTARDAANSAMTARRQSGVSENEEGGVATLNIRLLGPCSVTRAAYIAMRTKKSIQELSK